MDFVKELLQLQLKCLVFCALVELAHEVSASLQDIEAELQGSSAQILQQIDISSQSIHANLTP
jgi:hypothetical protein